MHTPRIALALTAATAGWLFVGIGLTPTIGASATTPVTVQAQPSTGVADGQAISVTGSGFSSGVTVVIIECQTGTASEAGCDLSTDFYTTATSAGAISTPFIASRYLHLSNPVPITVDCAVAGACFLAAANPSNISEAASTPLTFDPTSPPPPALVIGGSLAQTGTVDHKTGVAMVSGTITCNRPVFASVFGQLSQTYHRFVFTSYFSMNVLCTSSTNWSATVQPTNGLFGRGTATVVGSANGYVGGVSSQVGLSGTVTLNFPKT